MTCAECYADLTLQPHAEFCPFAYDAEGVEDLKLHEAVIRPEGFQLRNHGALPFERH
jgi:hypothetical protein